MSNNPLSPMRQRYSRLRRKQVATLRAREAEALERQRNDLAGEVEPRAQGDQEQRRIGAEPG